MIFRRSRKIGRNSEIAPDEIFLDSSNLPEFDRDQFEGQIEKPISKRSLTIAGVFFLVIAIIFTSRIFNLQIADGGKYKEISENNRLHHSIIFAERGALTDREGKLLAWNSIDPNQNEFSLRSYLEESGTHSLLGYVKYPKKDKYGFYYNTAYDGADGVEKFYNNALSGQHGLKITETDALGHTVSESTIRPTKKGDNIALSIDKDAQIAMYKAIQEMARRSGFRGGAGIIMNVNTGEVLVSVSYPEYDSNIMTSGKDVTAINGYMQSDSTPFLDRVSSGLYTPGSIVKPILAFAALSEKVITPEKKIESTGELKVPNPYKPGEFSIFKDWKAHGWTDMRESIAVSSDTYFYEIGGGYPGQKGLGIENIDKYAKIFGFGDGLDGTFFSGKKGIIPTPDWKKENFDGDIWRLGDTYNTAIGQYGFQVTPVQAVRAIASIANGGTLLTPDILSTTTRREIEAKGLSGGEKISSKSIASQLANSPSPEDISNWFKVVREGMRLTVTQGTMKSIDFDYVHVAGKTGTAQLGISKKFINSWSVGFFPYEQPRYAFAVLLEKGPEDATMGATAAMAQWLDWMHVYDSQYLQ